MRELKNLSEVHDAIESGGYFIIHAPSRGDTGGTIIHEASCHVVERYALRHLHLYGGGYGMAAGSKRKRYWHVPKYMSKPGPYPGSVLVLAAGLTENAAARMCMRCLGDHVAAHGEKRQ